jgi:hypothetical protein
MAAAMFLIVWRSGLRGRRTLEESGPNVGVRCNNVVLTWLISDGSIDPLDEQEDGNEEEESGGVMIGGVGEQKKQESEDGREKCDRLPSTNFWSADHRWIECIAWG